MSRDPASPDEPAAAPAPGGAPWLAILLTLLAGAGLRAVVVLDAGSIPLGELPAWEAEGLRLSLEAPDWPPLNGLRPAGSTALHDRVAELLGVARADAARWLGFGLSLLTLASLLTGAWVLSGRLGFGSRRAGPLCLGVLLLWALHPSGILAARAPTWEAWLGAVAPLLLVGCAAAASRRAWLGALLLALVAGGVLVLGGLLWVAALLVAVLAFLLPVPRAGAALRALGVALVALAIWGASERFGPDPRQWEPDAAWSYAALEWLAPDHPPYQAMAWRQPARNAEVRARVWDALRESDPARRLGELLVRVRELGFGPGRLDALAQQAARAAPGAASPWRVGLAALDLLLRGGCLLFALTVLGLFRTAEPSSGWPRVAACAGVLALVLLGAALATSPLALWPVDALLVAVAGAGLAGAQRARGGTRLAAFALGGALLLSFCYVAGVRDRPLDAHLWHRGEGVFPGPSLLELLDAPPPATLAEELAAGAHYLADHTPFLRHPELGMEHALEATRLAPQSDEATVLQVRALAAQGLYEEAAFLAQAAFEATERTSRRLEVLLGWVQLQQRNDRRPAVR